MIIKLFIIALAIYLIPTIYRALKVLLSGVTNLFLNLMGLFIRIKPCTCGDKEICVSYSNGDDSGYALICQNCYNKTEVYPTIYQAKMAWNRNIR